MKRAARRRARKNEQPEAPAEHEAERSDATPEEAQRVQLAEFARRFDVGMLTTRRADGVLMSRPMYLASVDDDACVWLITSTDSPIAAEVQSDPHVCLSMQSRMRFVSLYGTAEFVQETKEIERRFRQSFRVWFPNGPSDEHVTLLKLSPSEAEYWDQSGAYGVQLAVKAASALLRRRSLAETKLLGHEHLYIAQASP